MTRAAVVTSEGVARGTLARLAQKNEIVYFIPQVGFGCVNQLTLMLSSLSSMAIDSLHHHCRTICKSTLVLIAHKFHTVHSETSVYCIVTFLAFTMLQTTTCIITNVAVATADSEDKKRRRRRNRKSPSYHTDDCSSTCGTSLSSDSSSEKSHQPQHQSKRGRGKKQLQFHLSKEEQAKYVALDCEMVGVLSARARNPIGFLLVANNCLFMNYAPLKVQNLVVRWYVGIATHNVDCTYVTFSVSPCWFML